MQGCKWINVNGRMYPAGDAVFTFNRAISYGDGLFESIRIHNGELLFFYDHIGRLLNGMNALHMTIPDAYSDFFFHKQIIDLAIKEQAGANARVRLGVFRSGGGLYEPDINIPEYYLQVMKLDLPYVWDESPVKLGVFEAVPKNFSAISFIKSMNALPYVLAGIYRKENQFNDCLLVNSSGQVADAISSNIFWIKNEVYYTPPLSVGGVAGILRKQITRLLADRQISCKEKSITPDQLANADEIFLTNTGRGIRPVTEFAGKQFKTGKTKQLFQVLMESLSE